MYFFACIVQQICIDSVPQAFLNISHNVKIDKYIKYSDNKHGNTETISPNWYNMMLQIFLIMLAIIIQ